MASRSTATGTGSADRERAAAAQPAADDRDRTPRRERPRIWVLQFGPCWCRAEPEQDGSFDFVRYRTAEVGPHILERDILIVSRRIAVGSDRMLRQVQERVPNPHLLVATGHCPAANRFWDGLPGGWTPIEELLAPDLVVDECFSGYPEMVLAAILGHAPTGALDESPPTAIPAEPVRS